MNVLTDVQLACSDDTTPEADTITAWVSRAVAATGVSRDHEVSVRVVSKEEIRQLNRDYRDKDQPTNVLSFPSGPIEGLPDDEPVPLGDIVVCASVVAAEAAAQGKRLQDHWAHMLVHGTLHLMGFDHQEESEAAEMEGKETKILTGHGLPDPYGEPAHNC
ncbi:MAG: rRNA maturation RNase YbeY [Woeseiaceae bacterium]|nr:rRNA maturation RNase YbeY [Woeseiaceae bacterium]